MKTAEIIKRFGCEPEDEYDKALIFSLKKWIADEINEMCDNGICSLAFSLDAMGRSKDNLKATMLGTIIRTTTLFLFSLLRIGLYGYIISTSIHVIFVTTYNYYQVKKYLANFTTFSQK